MVLTSGTTARPKGVVLSERALAASADAWLAALPPATGWLLALGLGHVAGLGVLWRAIASGVPMRIADGSEPAALADAIACARGRATSRSSRPSSPACSTPPATRRRRPTSARSCSAAGSIPAALVTRAIDAGWPVVPTYGLCEMGSGVTALPTAEAREAPGSAGRALPGMSLSIEEPGRDGVGEIVVAGPRAVQRLRGRGPGARRARSGPATSAGSTTRAGCTSSTGARTGSCAAARTSIPAEVEAVLERAPGHRRCRRRGASRTRRSGQVPVAAIVVRPDAADPGDDAHAAHVPRVAGRVQGPGRDRPARRLAADVRRQAPPRRRPRARRRRPRRASSRGPAATRSAGGSPARARRRSSCSPARSDTPPSSTGSRPRSRARATLTVHALDRRGIGTSPARAAAPPSTSTCTFATSSPTSTPAGSTAPCVVGVSFGGVVALEAAARRPGPRRDRRRLGAAVRAARRRRVASPGSRARRRGHRRGPTTPAARPPRPRRSSAHVAGDDAWDRLPPRARDVPRPRGRRRARRLGAHRPRPRRASPASTRPSTSSTAARASRSTRRSPTSSPRRIPRRPPPRPRGPRPPRPDHRRPSGSPMPIRDALGRGPRPRPPTTPSPPWSPAR